MCIIARAMRDRGHEPVFMRCFEGFSRCSVMDMHGHKHVGDATVKKQGCYQCVHQSLQLLGRYGLEAIDLKALLSPEVVLAAKSAWTIPSETLMSFEKDGVALGKMAAVNVALHFKLSDLNCPSAEVELAWRQNLESCLKTYFAVSTVLKRLDVRALVHFNDYSMPLAARMAAKKRGLNAISLTQPGHKGVDRTRVMLQPDIWGITKLFQRDHWPQWRDLALPTERVKEIADDLFVRMRGKGAHNYSPGKIHDESGVKDRLGLSKGKKTVVAFTSSLDEFTAYRMTYEAVGVPVPPVRMAFHDQIEWLTRLVLHFEGREDAELVVRIHPREGANRRDGVNSHHLGLLRERFSRKYRNCRFVWPETPVSSYDLMEIADLGLVSWSSTALEMARFGVPVLSSTLDVVSYTSEDFLEFVDTPEGHIERISERLSRPTASLDAVIGAFRCYNLLGLGTTISLADVVPHSDYYELPDYRTPGEATTIEAIIMKGANVLDINRERLKAAQEPGSAREEAVVLRTQLRRVIHYFHTGEERSQPPTIQTALLGPGEIEKASFASALDSAVLAVAGGRTRYFFDGREYARFSPLCARLAPLCTEVLTADVKMDLLA